MQILLRTFHHPSPLPGLLPSLEGIGFSVVFLLHSSSFFLHRLRNCVSCSVEFLLVAVEL
jgi:hypothetical protein